MEELSRDLAMQEQVEDLLNNIMLFLVHLGTVISFFFPLSEHLKLGIHLLLVSLQLGLVDLHVELVEIFF